MGELGITINDLDVCHECGHNVAMIFNDERTGWFIACGFRPCGHQTKHHAELLTAADEWGLV